MLPPLNRRDGPNEDRRGRPTEDGTGYVWLFLWIAAVLLVTWKLVDG